MLSAPLAVILATAVAAPPAAAQPVAPYRLPKAAKEHTQDVADGQHAYSLQMGGTLDEFNTAEFLPTYSGCMRQEWKFQPNDYLVIENVGDTNVVNPRIVVNGRRNWYSADDILTSVLKPGMSDAEKAMAIFRFSSSHEVQCHENDRRPGPLYPDAATNPSRNDFKERANPVKAANFYYCSGCQFGATNFVILCRHAGFPARSVWMCPLEEFVSHCVGEVWYDGGWHLYDPERRSFYLAEDNRTVASYQQLHQKPSLASRTHDAGFASKGMKSHDRDYEKFYPPSVMPTEQWLSSMEITLRPGEKLIRRWDHIGKFRFGHNPRNRGNLPYRLANGKIVYRPRFDGDLFYRGIVSALNAANIRAEGDDWRIQSQAAGTPGIVIYKVTSCYPIVGGVVGGSFLRKTEGDVCRIAVSVHDSDWIEVWSAGATGKFEACVSIDRALDPGPTSAIYEYYVRFELMSETSAADAALLEAYIETDLQMATTSLPSLSIGTNEVSYTDQSPGARDVRITHGWHESSATQVPAPPTSPVSPPEGSPVDLSSLQTLVWKPATDPDGDPIAQYHIQVSPRRDMLHPVSPNFDLIIPGKNPEWQIPSGWLTKGRTYYWHVKAKDKWGSWSNWSPVWSFTIKD